MVSFQSDEEGEEKLMSGDGNHGHGLSSFFDPILERACVHICPPGVPVKDEEEALQLLEECAQEAGDSVGAVRLAYREAYKHYLSPDPDPPNPLFQPAA